MAKTTADTAYVIVGKWNGHTQIWRGGVFDSSDEALEQWRIYCDDHTGVKPEFLPEFLHVKSITP